MTDEDKKPSKFICILEDSEELTWVYEEIFAGLYDLKIFPSVETFLSELDRIEKIILLILDVHLQDGNLLDSIDSQPRLADLCSHIPTIVITSDLSDMVTEGCFHKLNPDEYISKPFAKKELLYKVKRIVDRAPEITVCQHTFTIGHQGMISEPLTANEFKLFCYLLEAPESCVMICEAGQAIFGISNAAKRISVHLAHLRKKLLPVGVRIDPAEPGQLRLRTG